MKIRQIGPIAALDFDALAPTGFTKPSPAGSVVRGTHGVNKEALCWDFTVGISVDQSGAKEGWTAFFNGQPLRQSPITESYYRFTVPAGTTLNAEGTPLAVASISNNQMRGLSLFKLTN
ncbi:unannotated protein [freshwater metagenome]|uniref:Unannotated protein n=1 Tax=freshwater metagenome TaxID=449393 RepID=A0A6J6MPM6_9ZZZZ|nr:hypothetical protein [Actinomycetota bacterium]MSZ41872.1 hypothetical protein [Actinomycetota bacterium]